MKNNLIGLTIGAAVAIIVLASVLVPVVDDAQTTIGPVTTRTSSGANVGGEGLAFYEIGNDTLTYTIEETSAPIKINGEEVSYVSAATWGAIIMADSGVVMCRSDTHFIQSATYGETDAPAVVFVAPVTVVVDGSNKTITTTNNEHTAVIEYSEAYCMQKVDDAKLGRLNMVGITDRAGDIYVNDIGDLKTWGVYTSGNNDTSYTLENGKVTTAVDYPSSLNYTLTKVDGTTDIYHLDALSISIGGETFVPYYCLVPATVEGREESSASPIIGVIPMLVIVAIIVGVASVALRSRD